VKTQVSWKLSACATLSVDSFDLTRASLRRDPRLQRVRNGSREHCPIANTSSSIPRDLKNAVLADRRNTSLRPLADAFERNVAIGGALFYLISRAGEYLIE